MRLLETGHGPLPLPAFLPDATRGAVRTVDPADLAAVGVEAICVNTFHLAQEPGAVAIEKLGGIHRFTGFDGPVLSDSGGFQILSLIASGAIDGSASAKGLRWRAKHSKSGESELLTPEKCIRWQAKLGADLLVCLDHCTRPDESIEEQRVSVEHTVNWASECRVARDRIAQESGRALPLLAVVQGGNDPALRRECAERLLAIGFDGYAFGGWPIGADGSLVESVALVASLVPRDVPLWGLGIGKPENLVAAARLGYSLFDCVLPTRDARHGRLYVRTGAAIGGAGEPTALSSTSASSAATPRGAGADSWYDHLYLGDTKHAVDERPIEPGCRCPTCSRHSRGYLHHLWQVKEPLALRLATLHNLSFYSRLVRELRDAQDTAEAANSVGGARGSS